MNHPAMFISLNELGSLVLDIDGGRVDATFLRADGTTGDYFTLLKNLDGSDCPDINGDLAVDFQDLLVVLASWGPCIDCPADFDNSGAVDFQDLLTVLAAWGPCP